MSSDAAPPHYDEIIVSKGVRIPFVPHIITPKIERPLRNGRYEGGEAAATLGQILRRGDVVMEFGAGLGLCSTIAAMHPDVARVVTFEANPDLIPLIRETHRLNALNNIEVRHGIVAPEGSASEKFYLRRDFWGSSMEPDSRPYQRVVDLPAFDVNELIAEIRPTVIVCDIEGAELTLFDHADLSSVRAIVCELHNKVYGDEGEQHIINLMNRRGLTHLEGERSGSVKLFSREPVEGMKATARDDAPAAAAQPAARPASEPRVLVATCMKNEGPFILEWLAWQRAVGVNDFIIFTNDLSDGSQEMLDYLHAAGQLTHLPNPATILGSPAFQPVALKYTHLMPQFRAADYFISMDVDEFINVRTGDGTLGALFAHVGPFDALSMSEVTHGTNGIEHFSDGWVTDLFPAHGTETPGRNLSRRGVKTIVRLGDKLSMARNHRADFHPGSDPRWLDGSGRETRHFLDDPGENGHDARGSFDLVTLEHYALRSDESFLAKKDRGDVVSATRSVSRRYFRLRNSDTDRHPDPIITDAARAYYATYFASDTKLMELHNICCMRHKERIREILTMPEYQAELEWIRASRAGGPQDDDAGEDE
ncbi:MAG: FkbM family methyltransferase [Paracoccus sp. (in: a-proteobacteria)]|nr:FkbM family methyltransferase [Paracoccus sp. (in: a-proteobacteria)]